MVPLFPPSTYVQTSRGPIKAIRIKVPVGIPTADGGLEIPNRVFVGGIPSETTELELETFFCDYGLVMDVRIVTDRITGESKGYGFVTFDENEDISKLLKTQTITMKGKKLRLRKAIRRNSSQFVDNKSDSSTSPTLTGTNSGGNIEKELTSKFDLLCVDESTSKPSSNSEPVLLVRSQPAVENSSASTHYANIPFSTNYQQPIQPTYYPVTTSFQSIQHCTSTSPQQSYTPIQYCNQGGQISHQYNHPAYFVPIYPPPPQPYGSYAYPMY